MTTGKLARVPGVGATAQAREAILRYAMRRETCRGGEGEPRRGGTCNHLHRTSGHKSEKKVLFGRALSESKEGVIKKI